MQIDLLELDDARSFQELPPKVQQRKHPNHRIRKEERRKLPIALDENWEAVQQRHDDAAGQRIPRKVWLQYALVWKTIPGDALCRASFLEPRVGESNDGKVDQLRCCDLSSCQHGKVYFVGAMSHLPR